MKKIFLISLFILFAGLYLLNPGVISHAQSADSFSFGAAGDFANGSNFRATVDAVARENPNFFLTLGDHSYSSGAESQWCSVWKSKFPNVFLIAGNHDVGEGSGGNISNYIQHCPFTLSGLQGNYGHQYYFDYPSGSPIARFVLIRPGIRGSGIIDYNSGGAGYNFTRDAIDDARNKNIPWVVVGFHKNYISAMEKPNELGTDLMKLLLDKKVDLILQGHEHGYERSKQLTTSGSCPTLPTNTYNAGCVADADNSLQKGAGSVIHIIGTGGQGLRGLNQNDSEYPYFASANNTANGFGMFTLSRSEMRFNFVKSAGGAFSDSFTISGNQSPPSVGPSATPGVQTPAATVPPSVTPTPAPCPAVNSNGTAIFGVNLEQNTYKLWARMGSQGSNSNAFYVQVDQNCPVVMGDSDSIPSGSWQWIDYKNGSQGDKALLSLSSGAHSIKLMNKETGTKLDKIILTSDHNCVPQGDGSNCTSVIVVPSPTPTGVTVPTVGPTPTPPTTSGIIINASEDSHVNKRKPSVNYGDSKVLHVDGSPQEITYLKFDLAGLKDQKVDKAVVKLTVSNYSRQPQVLYSVSGDWKESSITFADRPGFGSKIAETNGADVGDIISIDITDAVKNAGTGILSIAIENKKADALYLHSKEESGKGPVLLINGSEADSKSFFLPSSKVSPDRRTNVKDESDDDDD